MTNPKDRVLEENVARFVRDGALPMTEDRMRRAYQAFRVRTVLRDASEDSVPHAGRRAALAAVAASLACVGAVGWFMAKSFIPTEMVREEVSLKSAAQEAPKAAQENPLPGVHSARAMGNDIFDAIDQFVKAEGKEKRGGVSLNLELQSLDIQLNTTPGIELLSVLLRGRISSLESLSALRKELRKIASLKSIEYVGAIGPLQSGFYPFSLRVSEHFEWKPKGTAPPDEDALTVLSSKAGEAGLPPEAVSYSKRAPVQHGGWTEGLTTVSVLSADITLARFMDFLRRVEQASASLTVNRLSLSLAGGSINQAHADIASIIGMPDRIGDAYSAEKFKSKNLASADNRQVWGIDPAEIDWVSRNIDRILDGDVRLAPEPGGGLRIESIKPGSVVAARGLVAGDLLREIHGNAVRSVAEVRTLMNNPAMKQKTALRLTIERAGKPVVIEYQPLTR